VKVLLLKDVKSFGKRDEIHEASEGYARNFLIPRRFACAATPQVLAAWESRKKEREQDHSARVAELKAVAQRIATLKLTFRLKVGEKGEVFGSVTHKDIEAAFSREGFPGVRIELERPLKALGEKTIPVDCGEGIQTTVPVSLLPENA